jgi:hypothetical protein
MWPFVFAVVCARLAGRAGVLVTSVVETSLRSVFVIREEGDIGPTL